ncbi:hypothetical protein L1987_49585 [Smallanthus sonchifolius]|uniref:Uncharacterized protein n=1 Tax=Smallanthus sonchifolius TaxID=185202 RepID=A0ACB9FWR5_9ASTR|nr:hypothetical protein L1987_49585 [Smallanthus sonchifolius]
MLLQNLPPRGGSLEAVRDGQVKLGLLGLGLDERTGSPGLERMICKTGNTVSLATSRRGFLLVTTLRRENNLTFEIGPTIYKHGFRFPHPCCTLAVTHTQPRQAFSRGRPSAAAGGPPCTPYNRPSPSCCACALSRDISLAVTRLWLGVPQRRMASQPWQAISRGRLSAAAGSQPRPALSLMLDHLSSSGR